MMRLLIELLNDDSGSTIVEYGIVVALLAAGATAVLYSLGATSNAAYSSVASSMDSFQNAPPP